MKTLSPEGRSLLVGFEGLRIRPYRDAVGIWTIGVGHVIRAHDADGELLRGWKVPGFALTKEQCWQLLDDDMYDFEVRLEELIGSEHLDQYQWDALLSLSFNVGTQWAHIDRRERLKAGEWEFMQPVFGAYVKAGGRVLRGLVSRRQAEWEWFSFQRKGHHGS
jgi:lysozyme